MRYVPLIAALALGACGAQQAPASQTRPSVKVRTSPTGTVAGTARGLTEDGFAPLRAKVILRSADGGIEFQARSDSTGEFFFGPVPAGEYQLIVSAQGWAPTSRDLRLAPGEALHPDIALDPDSGASSEDGAPH